MKKVEKNKNYSKLSNSSSIFERNPKKTITIVVIFSLVLIVFGFEKYFAWKNIPLERSGTIRHIRLRENPPLSAFPVIPNEHYMKVCDHFDSSRHYLRIDEQGFIYPSRIHKIPDISIVFLGGSTTECRYVEQLNRFPYVVGRLLEKNNLKVNSYNGGVAGNDTLHSTNILINKALRLNPEFAVIMHNINDLSVLLSQKTYWHNIPTRGVIITETPTLTLKNTMRLLKNLLAPNLYIKIRNGFNTIRIKLGFEKREFARLLGLKAIDQKLLSDAFKKNLLMIVNVCKAQKITPVLMTQPSRLVQHPDDVIKGGAGNLPPMSDDEYFQIRNLFNLFNETIRNVGKENSVLVIELAKKIPPKEEYIYDVIHLTDRGSLLAAQIITENLEKYLKTEDLNQ